jgi:hypothetical protein
MDIFFLISLYDLMLRPVGGKLCVNAISCFTAGELTAGLSLCIVSLNLENNISFNSFKKLKL